MREKLIPVLERAGAAVLYVDLWQRRVSDPGEIIASAVGTTLEKKGALRRLLGHAGALERPSAGNLSLSLRRSRGDGTRRFSMTPASVAPSDEHARVIVLIVDEARHAITTAAGSDALFGPKPARDELDGSKHHGRRVVATGSSSDELATLRNGGSTAVPSPALGEDYVRRFIACRQEAADGFGLQDGDGRLPRCGRPVSSGEPRAATTRLWFLLKPKTKPLSKL